MDVSFFDVTQRRRLLDGESDEVFYAVFAFEEETCVLDEKVVRFDHVRVAEGERTLDHVLQLPHVSGPICFLELRDRGVPESTFRSTEALEKVLSEWQDVSGALTQRGNRDRNHVEPVVEILSESPLPDVAGELRG